MDRTVLIRRSLNIFMFGLIGLIPALGLFPALYAVVAGIFLRRRARNEWNPAARQLNLGVFLGLLSLGISFLAVLIILFQIASGSFEPTIYD